MRRTMEDGDDEEEQNYGPRRPFQRAALGSPSPSSSSLSSSLSPLSPPSARRYQHQPSLSYQSPSRNALPSPPRLYSPQSSPDRQNSGGGGRNMRLSEMLGRQAQALPYKRELEDCDTTDTEMTADSVGAPVPPPSPRVITEAPSPHHHASPPHSPSSPGAEHIFPGRNGGSSKQRANSRNTKNRPVTSDADHAPMPKDMDDDGCLTRLRQLCLCWCLALVVSLAVAAGLATFFSLKREGYPDETTNNNNGAATGGNVNDSSLSSTRVIDDPHEKLAIVLQAMETNNLTRAYVDIFAGNVPVNDLVGKSNDTDADPMIRAMSWLIHDDSFNQSSELVQRFALAAIYYAAGGEEWTHANDWLSPDKSICSGWYGVTCCGEIYNDVALRCAHKHDKEIAEIDLHHNNLQGTISDAFALLSDLQVLWLDSNKLTGPLKGGLFGKFPSLSELYVQHNRLTGPIDESLRDNGALLTLFLQGNQFEGESPSSFCSRCPLHEHDCPEFFAYGMDCNRNPCPEDCCMHGVSTRLHCYNSYE